MILAKARRAQTTRTFCNLRNLERQRYTVAPRCQNCWFLRRLKNKAIVESCVHELHHWKMVKVGKAHLDERSSSVGQEPRADHVSKQAGIKSARSFGVARELPVVSLRGFVEVNRRPSLLHAWRLGHHHHVFGVVNLRTEGTWTIENSSL